MAKPPEPAHHRLVTRAMQVVGPATTTDRSPVAADVDAPPRQIFPVPVLASARTAVAPAARTTAVVRRVYDPTIDNGNRQAGLTYIANNAARIVGAFQVVLNGLRVDAQGPTTAAKSGPETIGVALRALVDKSSPDYLPAAHLLNTNVQPAARQNQVTELAVRALNYMEAETATKHVTAGAVTAIHVGTEFSFSDGLVHTKAAASINLKLIAPDKRTEQQKKPHAEASSRIGAWTEKARTSRDLIPGKPLIQTSQKNGAKAEYASTKVATRRRPCRARSASCRRTRSRRSSPSTSSASPRRKASPRMPRHRVGAATFPSISDQPSAGPTGPGR
jgi:hypothetical protein